MKVCWPPSSTVNPWKPNSSIVGSFWIIHSRSFKFREPYNWFCPPNVEIAPFQWTTKPFEHNCRTVLETKPSDPESGRDYRPWGSCQACGILTWEIPAVRISQVLLLGFTGIPSHSSFRGFYSVGWTFRSILFFLIFIDHSVWCFRTYQSLRHRAMNDSNNDCLVNHF